MLVSFVTAATLDDCIATGDHGVFINGDCYDCGEDDFVCPETYGAICSVQDPDCEITEEAYWSEDGVSAIKELEVVVDEDEVKLVVRNTGLEDGTEVTFEIKENDGLIGDDDITTVTATASGGDVIATWEITKEDLELTEGTDYSEFYFIATGDGLDISTADRDDDYKYLDLNVTIVGPSIVECADYSTNTTCIADDEDVGEDNVLSPKIEGLCSYDVFGFCDWNGSECQQVTNETADPSNPDDCRDARLDPCVYDQTTKIGDCDGGDDFFKVSYNSSQENCDAWTTGPIPCPEQVRLPFFGFLNIIASLAIISIIYAFFYRRS